MIHTIDLKFKDNHNAIASFLVETDKGPILIETGPHSTYPHLQKGIEKAGYQPSDIQHVFLSHIHLDHAGAAWAFAELGAKIYVHPRGAKHLISPERLMSSAKRIYQDQMDSLWGQMNPIPEIQVIICEDQCVYDFGNVTLKGWYTPGHAVHHIAWQMGTALFAGDVAGVRINNGMIVPPCPPPDINIEDWIASLNLIRGLELEEIYLTHFDKITDIKDHLNILEKRLIGWSNWIKPYFDEKTEIQTIIPLFSAYVINELRAFGIDEVGIQKYEAANPAWMSVAGLLRYWKKKTEREQERKEAGTGK
ncbi:MAG: MBL fold metallo-hydrolase [Bacteroidota bacterium]